METLNQELERDPVKAGMELGFWGWAQSVATLAQSYNMKHGKVSMEP